MVLCYVLVIVGQRLCVEVGESGAMMGWLLADLTVTVILHNW